MNELARFVHDLVSNRKDAGKVTSLSRLEQAALKDLQSLLHLSPRDLAAHLVQEEASEEWMKVSSTPETARP